MGAHPVDLIWHLARTEDWEVALVDGRYAISTLGLTLEQVGFIHCSSAHQLPGVVGRFYAHETAPLTLLGIDRDRLRTAGVEVRDEPGDPDHPDGERFPHVYGAVPVTAVTRIIPASVVDGRLVAPGWDDRPSTPRPLTSLYPDWPQHARRLRDGVCGLTTEQLALRAGPGQDPIWALAAHVAGARVYWLCGVFGEPGAERTPFTDPASGLGWEDDPDHPRSSEELAWALDSSWAVVQATLERWTMDDLDRTASRDVGGTVQVHSRASMLGRLSTHDAFHAGEISQLLGLHGLPAIDLWARRPPT